MPQPNSRQCLNCGAPYIVRGALFCGACICSRQRRQYADWTAGDGRQIFASFQLPSGRSVPVHLIGTFAAGGVEFA